MTSSLYRTSQPFGKGWSLLSLFPCLNIARSSVSFKKMGSQTEKGYFKNLEAQILFPFESLRQGILPRDFQPDGKGSKRRRVFGQQWGQPRRSINGLSFRVSGT